MTRYFFSLTAFVVATTLTQHPVTAAKPGGASASIIDLGTLGGTFSDAYGINNDPDNIQVVGRSTRADGFTHGFFWTAATRMIDLGTLGRNSNAEDINNHGAIAGSSEDAARQHWAVVWTMSSGVWTIEKLGTGSASGLNNGAGDPSAVAVVGSTFSSGGSHAVMWKKGTAEWLLEELGTLPGDMSSRANDVNDSETVVGVSISSTDVNRAFRWTPSTGMVELPGLGGDTNALAIGNNGDVAGISIDGAGNSHAVRWRAGDYALQDLGSLGGCCSQGYGINSAGAVVGVSDLAGKRSNSHAFLARAGALMTDLGALRGQSGARDLNDFGTIVGGSGNGQLHAAIWKLL